MARARQALKNSQCGALLLFDVNNIRYVTSTKIGEWERDKLTRFALLAGDQDPVLWDFGSAAVHHRLFCDWLPAENFRAGLTGLRGTVPPAAGLMRRHAQEIKDLLKSAGVADLPLGVDLIEPAMWFELERAGIKLADGQQVMLDAREIKSMDEITLLNQAAAMVDGVYHMIWEELKPGVRENDIVAKANAMLYVMGSDDVEAINAISGERCNPHPHNFTDRLIRPGDQAFFDILQSYMGYRTCYYRTFNVGRATESQRDAYKRAREWLDASIQMIRPGVTTDKVAAVWPKAEEFGFPDEMAAFGLQFGHGLGLALHERPIISRLVSLENPMEIKTGMVFALETYCPATDGASAARIEEEVVVTDTGCKVITLFPAEDLPISNAY
jgi:Xaa-Pro aminopeptidase